MEIIGTTDAMRHCDHAQSVFVETAEKWQKWKEISVLVNNTRYSILKLVLNNNKRKFLYKKKNKCKMAGGKTAQGGFQPVRLL